MHVYFYSFLVQLLAHQSRRLTRWAYSIPMIRRRHRCPSLSSFKLEYLWSKLANLDQILYVASLGWRKGCIRFWGRLDQNSGYHGNRNPPLTYNGENDVSIFSWLFSIWSFFILAGNKDMHKISDEFEFLPLSIWKISHRLIMGKWYLLLGRSFFDQIIIKVAGNQDRHKSLDKFHFGPDQTTHFGVTCL